MQNGINALRQKADTENDNMYSMLKNDTEFIASHIDFAIAFRPVKWKEDIKWIPCLIHRYKGGWKRVIIQNAYCAECDWKGIAANPTDPDLYVTMENQFAILREMNHLSFCKCPKCGNQISTKAIWIEGI